MTTPNRQKSKAKKKLTLKINALHPGNWSHDQFRRLSLNVYSTTEQTRTPVYKGLVIYCVKEFQFLKYISTFHKHYKP